MNDFNDNRNDDIAQLFRENADKLTERPPMQSWDRLERKLEMRRLRKRTVMYRYTSLAAAVIGVFALIMAIRLVNTVVGIEEGDKLATEQPLTEDERKIAEAIKEHREEQRVEQEELDKIVDKDVPSKTKDAKQGTNRRENPPVVKLDEKKPKNSPTEAPAKKLENAPKPQSPATANKKPDGYQPPIAMVDDDVEPVAEEEAEELVELDVVKPTDAKKEAEYKPTPDNKVIIAKEEKAKATKQNKDALNTSGRDKADEAAGDDVTLDEIAVAPSKQSKSRAKNQVESYSVSQLAKFGWMAGNWKGDGDDINKSYESWYMDAAGIIGEGYVMENGEKKFQEYMKIYEKGKDLYFESSVDNSKKFKTFKLKSYDGTQAIFERKGKKFPNQVVIQKFSNNSFSIIYKNKKGTSIKENQSKYFQKRNSISSERVARKMKRY